MAKRKRNPLQWLIDSAPEKLPTPSAMTQMLHEQKVNRPRNWKSWLKYKVQEYFENDFSEPDQIELLQARLIYSLAYVKAKREGILTTKITEAARAAWDIEGGAFDPEVKMLFKIAKSSREKQEKTNMGIAKKVAKKAKRMLLNKPFGPVVRSLGIAGYSTDQVMNLLKRENICSTKSSVACFMSEGRSGRKAPADVSKAALEKLMKNL